MMVLLYHKNTKGPQNLQNYHGFADELGETFAAFGYPNKRKFPWARSQALVRLSAHTTREEEGLFSSMKARNSDNQHTIGEHVLELLSPYVDGETSIDETRHVERHVAACSLCAGQLAFLRATARTLRQTTPVFPSPDLFARIARATYEKPTFSQRVAALLRPAPVRVALGGALAAGIVAAVIVPARLNVAPPSSQHGGELAAVPAAPSHKVTPPYTAAPSKPSHASTPSLAAGYAKNTLPNIASTQTPEKKPVASLATPFHPLVSKPATANTARETIAANVRPLLSTISTHDNRANRTVPLAASHPVPAAPVLNVARLHLSRKPTLLAMNNRAAGFANDLSSRSAPPPRLARPETKIEVGSSAVATVAPVAVKPDTKTSELALPTPKISKGAASETVAAVATPPVRFVRPDAPRRFSLDGAGTQNKSPSGMTLIAEHDGSSPGGIDGHFGIVQAPMGSR